MVRDLLLLTREAEVPISLRKFSSKIDNSLKNLEIDVELKDGDLFNVSEILTDSCISLICEYQELD